MSLPHFFAGAPEPGARVRLDGDDARHAAGSLRMRAGDTFTSSDGRGALARCRVERAGSSWVEAEVIERSVEPWPTPSLAVALAAPKSERLAWAVQKLTELGTDRIVVVEATRSVRRWAGERAERLAGRIESIARESAKQSRRRFLPEVSGPVSWRDAVDAALGEGPAIVLWEGAKSGLASLLPESPPRLSLLVGPEGGIPEDDARDAEARGALLASLGPTVLRTETAAVAAAAVALAAYGRLG